MTEVEQFFNEIQRNLLNQHHNSMSLYTSFKMKLKQHTMFWIFDFTVSMIAFLSSQLVPDIQTWFQKLLAQVSAFSIHDYCILCYPSCLSKSLPHV